MKTTSRFALVAAAGIMMGGFSLSAKAADLGGDCCADLEERVAELEATSVRKGNRKVSLELSGQVNRALLVWNDGRDSDAYIVDNDYSSTRFRLRGTGQMAAGWKAGFFVELAVRDASSVTVNQFDDEGKTTNFPAPNEDNYIQIRQANVFVESEKFGRITVGQQSPSTDDITFITVGGAISDPSTYYNQAFFLRSSNPNTVNTVAGAGGSQGGTGRGIRNLQWGTIATSLDQARGDFVRYDAPSIYGFIFSAAWGENDIWDVAVRYQKEWNSIRISGGVGYSYNGDSNAGITNAAANGGGIQTNAQGNSLGGRQNDQIKGSISAIHIPTGVFVTFAAAVQTFEDALNGQNKDGNFYYWQGGITKRFFDVGATTFHGEYATYNDFGVGQAQILDASNAAGTNVLSSSEVRRYGFGATQAFDGAALELYVYYFHYEADLEIRATNNPASALTRVGVEDFDAVLTGARIKF